MADDENSRDSKESWPLAGRPGFLARRLHQIHVGLFMELCAEFRITPLQYSLLTALAECGTADQSTLARLVALDRTTTTGGLKRLESRGLIQRVTSERDRRSQECRMTAEGADLLERIREPARAAHEQTISKLSRSEQATFMRLLERVVLANEARDAVRMPEE
ncbi:MarR family winged helix-turn-helix transcriptional regulator [Chenggangzhangella methanolivorans]|uniref:MarR family transcriptional regulator n=1 Tax=Chenggangzhangella methanolivorans TaxID=1437009 RepID=A0A9E6RFF1_9HYPH|nr:MarR family transcriptional regulator [Chenggangzhangella methanolivorans]QZO00261.1 MarR family transcriptional regulator [Chenggangzhangella methanolivorans]